MPVLIRGLPIAFSTRSITERTSGETSSFVSGRIRAMSVLLSNWGTGAASFTRARPSPPAPQLGGRGDPLLLLAQHWERGSRVGGRSKRGGEELHLLEPPSPMPDSLSEVKLVTRAT